MTYTPNFSDPRIQRAVKRAIEFVELRISNSSSNWVSSREIDKHLTHSGRPLGKYLRNKLLIVSDNYYNFNTGQCKKYTKNKLGIKELKSAIDFKSIDMALPDELDQQIELGQFDYVEKSDRLFNPIQFIPSNIRGPLMANRGYRYSYDIEAAAPTLLYQQAQRLARARQQNLHLSTIEQYINDRSTIRRRISENSDCPEDIVKKVINALFQGGHLTCHWDSKLFSDLNRDYSLIKRLQVDPTIIEINKDVKSLWASLRDQFPVRYITDKNGKSRRQRLSGKDKSGYYRELEKEVGDVIRKSMRKYKKSLKEVLWIHDGWLCDEFVDPNLLIDEVKRQTGFVIKLDWGVYED